MPVTPLQRTLNAEALFTSNVNQHYTPRVYQDRVFTRTPGVEPLYAPGQLRNEFDFDSERGQYHIENGRQLAQAWEDQQGLLDDVSLFSTDSDVFSNYSVESSLADQRQSNFVFNRQLDNEERRANRPTVDENYVRPTTPNYWDREDSLSDTSSLSSFWSQEGLDPNFVPHPNPKIPPENAYRLFGPDEKPSVPYPDLPPSYWSSNMEVAAEAIKPKVLGSSEGSWMNKGGLGGLFAGVGNVAGSLVSGSMGLIGTSMHDSAMEGMQSSRQDYESQMTLMRQSYGATMQANSFAHQNQLSAQNYEQQLGLEDNRFDNTMSMYNSLMSQKVNAVTQAGLPSYVAYMPGMAAFQPRTTQMGPGKMTYTSQLPGNPTTTPYTGAAPQAALGWGEMPSPAVPPTS